LIKFAPTWLLAAMIFVAAPAAIATEMPEAETTFGQKVDQTLERFRGYGADRKDEAVETGKELLDVLDQRIDSLQAGASDMADDAKAASRDEVERLKDLRASIAERLDAAGKETSSTWGRFKSAVGDAVTTFRDRMKEE
jgi:ABC-type transporter MlaC component